MEESTPTILINFFKEFIPANKGHAMALGFGLIVIGLCIWLTAYTSGLRGPLTYLDLSPGTSGPLVLGGVVLMVLGATMKLPE